MDGASSLAAMRERGGAAARRRVRGGGTASAPPASGLRPRGPAGLRHPRGPIGARLGQGESRRCALGADLGGRLLCAFRSGPIGARPAQGNIRRAAGAKLRRRFARFCGRYRARAPTRAGAGQRNIRRCRAAGTDFPGHARRRNELAWRIVGDGRRLGGLRGPQIEFRQPPGRLPAATRSRPWPGCGLGRTVAAAKLGPALSGFASCIAVVSHSPQSILGAAKPRIPPEGDISASTRRGTAVAPRKPVIGQLSDDFTAAVRQPPCGRRWW